MKTEEWQDKAAFIDKLRELTDRLNRCRAAYEAHTPLVSDEVYDILFSDLQTLESWLGLRMKNSPPRKITIWYETASTLRGIARRVEFFCLEERILLFHLGTCFCIELVLQ